MGLGIVDVVMLILSLIGSAAVGVYYSVMGRKSTPLEYLLGGRNMTPLPLALSLMVGTISAITIMGNTGEMYAHGTQLWLMDLGIIIGLVIIAKFFVPILYPLRLVSLYQYVEERFKSKRLRQATVLLQLFGGYFFIGFLLFPPSIALQHMTGLSIIVNIFIIGASCTIYSTFGGVKAVVYADSLQAVVMVVGVLAIIIQGCITIGGLEKVLDLAYHGDRIELFNLSLDPYQRHSFWLCTILGLFFGLANSGVNQSQVQRYFSTTSVKDAQWVVYYSAIFLVILRFLINLSGLVMYAYYKDCDPLGSKDPTAVSVFYVLQELTKVPGLAGLFVAAVYAAVLSSVSTQLNSMTALLWEDFLKVLPIFDGWREVKIGYLQKVIVFFSGVLGIVIALAVSQMGRSFLSTVLAINGATSGPQIGLFLVALFLPWVPGKSAMVGFAVSIVISMVIAVGQLTVPKPPNLPMSRDGCPVSTITTTTEVLNATDIYTTVMPNITLATTTVSSITTPPSESVPGEWLFGLSYCLNSLWGTALCILLSLIIASITGFNTPEDMDEKLVDPTMWRLFQDSIRLRVKKFFQKKILKRRQQPGEGGKEETATMEPLGNTPLSETREYEIDGKGVV